MFTMTPDRNGDRRRPGAEPVKNTTLEKTWVIPSAAGYVTSATAARQLYGAALPIETFWTFLGLSIAAFGIAGFLLSGLYLQLSRQRGEPIVRGPFRIVRNRGYLAGIVINGGLTVAAVSIWDLDGEHALQVILLCVAVWGICVYRHTGGSSSALAANGIGLCLTAQTGL